MSDRPATHLIVGPGEVFIDGEKVGELNNVRWEGDRLVGETMLPDFLDPANIPEGDEIPMRPFRRAGDIELSGSMTFKEPRPSLWTRLWCAGWWGHRPRRRTMWDLTKDTLTCECGKVTDTAENVARWPNPWRPNG